MNDSGHAGLISFHAPPPVPSASAAPKGPFPFPFVLSNITRFKKKKRYQTGGNPSFSGGGGEGGGEASEMSVILFEDFIMAYFFSIKVKLFSKLGSFGLSSPASLSQLVYVCVVGEVCDNPPWLFGFLAKRLSLGLSIAVGLAGGGPPPFFPLGMQR